MDSKLEENPMVPGENPVVPNQSGKPSHEHDVNLVREETGARSSVLAKLFSGYQAAKSRTRSETRATHAWKNYESRSSMMQKNAEHAPKSPSLTDKVRSLFGRH